MSCRFVRSCIFAGLFSLLLTPSSWAISDQSVCLNAFITQMRAQNMDVSQFLNCAPEGCRPLLHQALSSHDMSAAKTLLLSGADPSVKDIDGQTAFGIAENGGLAVQFQQMVSEIRGENGFLASVRSALREFDYFKDSDSRAKLTNEDIETIISMPVGQWTGRNSQFFTKNRHPEVAIMDFAIRRAHPDLIRFLIDNKSMAFPSDDSVNYNLWGIAFNEDDGGRFYDFVVSHNLPVKETYFLAWGMGPLSILFGQFVGVMPKKYPHYNAGEAPWKPDLEKVKFLLSKGINPAADGAFMDELFTHPREHEQIWNYLTNGDYPSKNLFRTGLVAAFVSKHNDKLTLSDLHYLDVHFQANQTDFNKSFGLENLGAKHVQYDPGVPALIYVNGVNSLKYIIRQHKVNPDEAIRFVTSSLRADLSPWERSWNPLSRISEATGRSGIAGQLIKLARELSTKRYSEIEERVRDLIANDNSKGSFAKSNEHYILARLQEMSYLLHEAKSDYRP